jgi:GT2 family glycosyltransferase
VQSRPEVSVVIVNYHTYNELAACLVAVQSRGRDEVIEIVVVDQDSDNAAIAEICEHFPAATIIPNGQNDGFAAGVNRGAGRTRGCYLLVLNPDTVVRPGLIDELAAWLEAHPDVAVVGPRILNADGSVQPSARRFPDLTTGLGGRQSWLARLWPSNWLSRRNLDWSRSSEPVDVDWVSGACMMIRRSAFDGVGGMDDRFFLYWEDADLCRRLRSAGFRTVYEPSVSAVHEGSRASQHAVVRSLVAFHRSAFHYYWKHGGVVARAFAPVVQAALLVRLVIALATRKEDATSAPR